MLKTEFKSIDDITTFLRIRGSGSDGESVTHELKGAPGGTKLRPNDKDLLAKEISAFANTYGGLVFFHAGSKSAIEAFPHESCSAIFTPLESWLRDSLEPRIAGISLEMTAGIFVIRIPESKTKPHRASTDRTYYYRHASTSVPMPEIMIGAMYRSQAHLTFEGWPNVTKDSSHMLTVHIYVRNNSNLAGTRPKIQLQLFGEISPRRLLEFRGGHDFGPPHTGRYRVTGTPTGEPFAFSFAKLSTNASYAKEVLYPQDSLSLTAFSKPDGDLSALRYIVARLDVMFQESARFTAHSLIDLDAPSAELVIARCDSAAEIEQIIRRYNGLMQQPAVASPIP